MYDLYGHVVQLSAYKNGEQIQESFSYHAFSEHQYDGVARTLVSQLQAQQFTRKILFVETVYYLPC